jgi:hypothetical protein
VKNTLEIVITPGTIQLLPFSSKRPFPLANIVLNLVCLARWATQRPDAMSSSPKRGERCEGSRASYAGALRSSALDAPCYLTLWAVRAGEGLLDTFLYGHVTFCHGKSEHHFGCIQRGC